ncbi:hypothetical protein V0288_08360 [Pannus brasiliensis CCIBt3594]|uniref:Uncharacterized protein n=1 Tax=Pannus brasiliensis CCIBt3594 TaxID=1427578 RepID=A0AAW9QJ55_9CHRO
MLQSVEGIYKQGKIELLEAPIDVEESRVIVTFLETENRQKSPKFMFFGMFSGNKKSTDEDFHLAEFQG